MVPDAAVLERVRRLSIRSMVAAALRSARFGLPQFRLPRGSTDEKALPRHLKAGLLLAEQFCLGTTGERDSFARRAAIAIGHAGTAANVRHYLTVRDSLPTMPSELRRMVERSHGDLASFTEQDVRMAERAALSVERLLQAVNRAAWIAYAQTPSEAERFIAGIPDCVAESLTFGYCNIADIDALERLSTGKGFPQMGEPVDPSAAGPLGQFVPDAEAP
jgi:hypothetical protein